MDEDQKTIHLAHLPKLVDQRDASRPLPSNQVISKRKRRIFLEQLAITGKVSASARAAGYNTTNVLLNARKSDPEFAKAWQDALEAFAPEVEAAIIKRAIEGVLEPQYHQGQVVGYKRVYSDGLLQTLAKATMPDKYGERKQIDINHHKTGVIIIAGSVGRSEKEWEMDSVHVHTQQKKLAAPQQEELVNVIDVESEPVKELTFEDLL